MCLGKIPAQAIHDPIIIGQILATGGFQGGAVFSQNGDHEGCRSLVKTGSRGFHAGKDGIPGPDLEGQYAVHPGLFPGLAREAFGIQKGVHMGGNLLGEDLGQHGIGIVPEIDFMAFPLDANPLAQIGFLGFPGAAHPGQMEFFGNGRAHPLLDLFNGVGEAGERALLGNAVGLVQAFQSVL